MLKKCSSGRWRQLGCEWRLKPGGPPLWLSNVVSIIALASGNSGQGCLHFKRRFRGFQGYVTATLCRVLRRLLRRWPR